jgi:hypothetical protein
VENVQATQLSRHASYCFPDGVRLAQVSVRIQHAHACLCRYLLLQARDGAAIPQSMHGNIGARACKRLQYGEPNACVRCGVAGGDVTTRVHLLSLQG